MKKTKVKTDMGTMEAHRFPEEIAVEVQDLLEKNHHQAIYGTGDR